ncbi:hypothetical protein V1264_024816 [Littorina saxatilis]|uniref:Uncharacterized protein n=1 Tax=Littorina saxatilis TaxID=31220 RepID=A0AAN9G0N1_9CAEN
MTMNRPLIILAGFCLVLLMALYGAHATPESDLSNRGPPLKARLRTPDNEVIQVEKRGCTPSGNACLSDRNCCSDWCRSFGTCF